MTKMQVGVWGGGSFGVALAKAAERGGHSVKLLSRKSVEGNGIQSVNDPAQLAGTDIIFLAVPSVHIEEIAVQLGKHIDGRHYLVHVSRGLVGDALEPVSHVLRRLTPARPSSPRIWMMPPCPTLPNACARIATPLAQRRRN